MVQEQQVIADADVVRRQKPLRHVLMVGLMLLGLWMISPMLTSTYVEAYVARLQSMAILNHMGHLSLDDQAYPINTEFLYVTRLGMVWLMQGAMLLFHSTELWVLRLVTIASFVLLVASSTVFARRWTTVPVWAVVACAILTPGVLEPSFFFADNIVSAALTSLAVALVVARVTPVRWLCIGGIVACAMLVRLDAVLIVPAVVALLWLAVRDKKRTAVAVLYGCIGAAIAFGLSYEVTGVSLVQALHVGQLFSRINNNPAIYQTGQLKTCLLIFFGFFGLISLPLVAVGAWHNLELHGRAWNIVLIGLPVLFYLAVIPHANEIRDFCIMGAPFVLLHAATGLQVTIVSLTGSSRLHKLSATALLCFFALVLVSPPYISMRDGPRVLVGRVYSPSFWRQWQGRTLGMVDEIRGIVEGMQPGQRTLVVTSQFEPERYLHLRLLQQGFAIDSATGSPAGCQSIETAHKGDITVFAIRTDNPYGMFTGSTAGSYLEDLQIVESLHCLQQEHIDRSYFFSIGKSGEPYWSALVGPEIGIPSRFPLPILHHASYGFFGNIALSQSDITQLRTLAQAALTTTAPTMTPPVSDLEFRKRVQRHFWNPRN